MTIVIIYPVGYCSHGKTGQARSTTYKTPVSERICTHTRFYRRPRQTSGNTHFLPSPSLSLSLQIRVYRCSPNTYTGRTVRWRARVSTRTRQAAAHSSADLRYCGGRSPRISVLVIRSYEWAHREESSSVAHVNQVYVRVFRLLSTFPCKALQRVSSWPVKVVCGRWRVHTRDRLIPPQYAHLDGAGRRIRTRVTRGGASWWMLEEQGAAQPTSLDLPTRITV